MAASLSQAQATAEDSDDEGLGIRGLGCSGCTERLHCTTCAWLTKFVFQDPTHQHWSAKKRNHMPDHRLGSGFAVWV